MTGEAPTTRSVKEDDLDVITDHFADIGAGRLHNGAALSGSNLAGLSETNLVALGGPNVEGRYRFEFKSGEEIYNLLTKNPKIKLLDVTFTDILGRWHHCCYVAKRLSLKQIIQGFGFDASSIRGFERIEKSDYVMQIDPSSCWIDPFASFPTLHATASLFTPDLKPYEKCPRQILQKTCELIKRKGIADNVIMGPEAEFFIFRSARFSSTPHSMSLALDSDEAYWSNEHMNDHASNRPNSIFCNGNSHSPMGNLGHRPNLKEGYMISRPVDKSADIRSEILLVLEQLGIDTEKHHHEVAACQMEINIGATEVLKCADNLLLLKYIVKNVCQRNNLTATFMPKPLSNDNGSGMHCNQSLMKGGKNIFYDPQAGLFQDLSQEALWYIGGILKHCSAIMAFACPTTNSYKRLVPHFEAPVNKCYSAGNRSAAIRIPMFTDEKTKRIEFRSPDASCCPYLAFSAMILAGIDGIENKIDPGAPSVGDLFSKVQVNLGSSSESTVLPKSLDDALEALRMDNEFLIKDGVFTPQFIQSYIEMKHQDSCTIQSSPHPQEFVMYYGC